MSLPPRYASGRAGFAGFGAGGATATAAAGSERRPLGAASANAGAHDADAYRSRSGGLAASLVKSTLAASGGRLASENRAAPVPAAATAVASKPPRALLASGGSSAASSVPSSADNSRAPSPAPPPSILKTSRGPSPAPPAAAVAAAQPEKAPAPVTAISAATGIASTGMLAPIAGGLRTRSPSPAPRPASALSSAPATPGRAPLPNPRDTDAVLRALEAVVGPPRSAMKATSAATAAPAADAAPRARASSNCGNSSSRDSSVEPLRATATTVAQQPVPALRAVVSGVIAASRIAAAAATPVARARVSLGGGGGGSSSGAAARRGGTRTSAEAEAAAAAEALAIVRAEAAAAEAAAARAAAAAAAAVSPVPSPVASPGGSASGDGGGGDPYGDFTDGWAGGGGGGATGGAASVASSSSLQYAHEERGQGEGEGIYADLSQPCVPDSPPLPPPVAALSFASSPPHFPLSAAASMASMTSLASSTLDYSPTTGARNRYGQEGGALSPSASSSHLPREQVITSPVVLRHRAGAGVGVSPVAAAVTSTPGRQTNQRGHYANECHSSDDEADQLGDEHPQHEQRGEELTDPTQQPHTPQPPPAGGRAGPSTSGPPPPPPPSDPVFVSRPKRAYRPSIALNEDEYDFAVIVRVDRTPKQTAAFARAAAQADALAAAGLSVHGNGATAGMLPTFAASSRRLLVDEEGAAADFYGGGSDPEEGGGQRRAARPGRPQYAAQVDEDDEDEAGDSASESDEDDMSDSTVSDTEGDEGSSTGSRSRRGGRGGTRRGASGGRLSLLLDSSVSSLRDAAGRTWKNLRTSIGGLRSPTSASRRPGTSSRRPAADASAVQIAMPPSPAERGSSSRRVTWGVGVPSSEDEEEESGHNGSPAPGASAARRPATPAASSQPRKGGLTVAVPPAAPTLPASLRRKASMHSSGSGAAPARLHKCSEIIQALRAAGLQAKRVRSLSRRTWLLKIRAPEWRLELEAEKLRHRMRRRDGGWSRFKRSQRYAFVQQALEAEEAGEGAQGVGAGKSQWSAADEEDEPLGTLVGVADSDEEQRLPRGAATPASAAAAARYASGSSSASSSLFHSSDRQLLIDHILRSSPAEGGAGLGTDTALGAFVAHMFPLHMQARLLELRSDWLASWRPKRSHNERDRIGVVASAAVSGPRYVDILPKGGAAAVAAGKSAAGGLQGASKAATQHEVATTMPKSSTADAASGCCAPRGLAPGSVVELNNGCCGAFRRPAPFFFLRPVWGLGRCCGRCGRSSRRLCGGILSQPLDRIAAYFGETVAFYFAWLEFYTRWLLLPAVVGLCLFVTQVTSGTLDVPYIPAFSIFMGVWSIFFLQFWKRRNAELAQRWGVLHYEDEEVVRPEFQGVWKRDVATGAAVRLYPKWKRVLKYTATVPFILTYLAGMVLLMIMVFSTRDRLLSRIDDFEVAKATREAYMANLTATWGSPEWTAYMDGAPPEPVLSLDIKSSIVEAWEGGIAGFVNLASSAGVAATTPTTTTVAATSSSTSGSVTSGTGGSSASTSSSSTASASSSGSASSSSGSTSATSSGAAASPSPAASSSSSSSRTILDIVKSKLSHLQALFSSNHDWRWWLVMVLPPVLYRSVMPFFDFVFSRMALLLNAWENHATQSQYRNHRIAKVFIYKFVTSFVSLFYYAYAPGHSQMSLFVQLATFLVVGQLFNNVLEVVSGTLRSAWREWRFRRLVRRAEDAGLTEGRRGRRLLRHAKSPAWAQARLPRYDTFNDYAEVLIQYGYVTFFAWAFPLAPLCALVNNVFEMRTDAYKLCYTTQRPIAHKAGGIGVWYNVVVAMSLAAVMSNCAHLALSSTQFQALFPGLTDVQRLLVVFCLEHLVLGLRLALSLLVPPIPAGVQDRMHRDAVALARLQGRKSVGSLGGGGGVVSVVSEGLAAAKAR